LDSNLLTKDTNGSNLPTRSGRESTERPEDERDRETETPKEATESMIHCLRELNGPSWHLLLKGSGKNKNSVSSGDNEVKVESS
jgi:hypothetical protein